MRVLQVAALSLSLMLTACASTPAAPAPTGPPPDWKLASASMATGNVLQGTVGNGGQISLIVNGHNMSGPVLSLYGSPRSIRGQGSSGGTIDISLKDDKAEGLVNSILFSCLVDEQPDGSFHITGAMGAGNTDYTISPQAIKGRIGTVVYELLWNGDKYEGRMVPGGYAFLQLPAVMASWSDVEAACMLSIVLSGL